MTSNERILNFLFVIFDNNYLGISFVYFDSQTKISFKQIKTTSKFREIFFGFVDSGLVIECHELIRNNEITEPQLFTLG